MNRRLAGILLLGAVAALGIHWRTRPPPAFSWRWQDAPLVPGSEVVGPGGAVRVMGGAVGASGDARWTMDLLTTTGLLGVGDREAPVWLVLEQPCESRATRGAEALTGPAPGTTRAGLIVGPACLGILGLAAPEPLDGEGLVAVGRGDLAALGPMPVVTSPAAWTDAPPGWEPLITIDGRPVALWRERTVAFALDPGLQARDLRQGDPSLADRDTDGLHGVKPNDLRPYSWPVDAWLRPGAESWTEVLIAALEIGAGGPLPRIWPLPSEAPSALVLTSDQDFAEAAWIDPILARTESAGGEMTVLTTAGTRQSNSAAAGGEGGERPGRSAQAFGHGVGAHPNVVGLERPEPASEAIAEQLRRLADLAPATARMHYLSWWGHGGPLLVLAEHGVAMDLSFVGIAPRLGGPGFGFGAGRPMRFHDGDDVLPLWVQPTHIEDDVLIGDLSYSAGLTSEEAVQASGRLMDLAMTHRTTVVANLHPLLVATQHGVLLDGLLAAAQARGLPIVSAERQAASATARLQFAQRATVRFTGQGWAVDGPATVAPVWLWSPGSGCPHPTPIRAGGVPGCLTRPALRPDSAP